MVLKSFFLNYYIVTILITIVTVNHANNNDFKCTENIDDFKCRLSTMTPYRFIANYNDEIMKFPGCEAKKIWLIFRHGTRLPGKKVIKLMKNLPHIRNEILNNCALNKCDLSTATIQRLKNWKLKIDYNDSKLLAEEGEDELIGLGERYQSRFPDLMPEKFDNNTFKFKFTDTQRANQSARHFTIGLFGKKESHKVWYPKAEKKDPILRFYKACDKWKNYMDNPVAHKEFNEFKNHKIVQSMLKKLSDRLNIDATFAIARSIRYMCAFEIAWKKKNISPWCDLLTPEDFKILEYADDLKYYWKDGYGYQLTYKQACSSLVDVFNFFNDGNLKLKTSAYFAHSGTLLKILSFLNVSKDESPIFHDSFHTSGDRKWRTSVIDAAATNLAFVLYECKSGPCILTLHQERIVNLPGCPENFPCELEVIKRNVPHSTEQCPFAEMCSIKN